MSDLDRAKQALIAADASGDTEAASAIASYIREMADQRGELTGAEKFEGLASSALRGASFGVGSKLKAGMGAAIAKPALEGVELLTGREAPSYSELYERQLSELQSQENRFREQMPIASIGAEIAGGIGSGIGLAGTAPARALWNMARRGGTFGKIGAGALAGETAQRVYEAGQAPSGEELDALTKEGISMGGVLGGAFPAAGALGRAVAPKVDEALLPIANLAKKYDIPLSIDQITSSRAIKNMQKVSQELPFSGQSFFRDKQMAAFNRALLRNIGIKGDKITRKAMDDAFFRVGAKFDSFGKGKTFDARALKMGIQEIVDEAPSFATQDAQKALGFNVNKVLSNVRQNMVQGEALNQLRNQVNRAARKAKDADTVELLKDLENVIVETLAQGDEAAIREAKKQYKNLLVLEPLAAKAKGGNVSTAQLTNRVNKIYGRQFVRGNAGEMGDLADIGRELLPELGGSDTTQKMLLTGSVVGGAVNPSTLLVSGGAMAINRALQRGVNRNQAIINAMTKEARSELMRLPASEANALLNSISLNLGLTSGIAQREGK